MIYRRNINLTAGDVDDAEGVWAELQRIRSHAMNLDHVNFRNGAVERDTIVDPNNTSQNGASITYDTTGSFAVQTDASTETLTEDDDDQVWHRDTDTTLTVRSKHDALWIIGFGAEFARNGASVLGAADRVEVDLRVQTTGGLLAAWSVGVMGDQPGLLPDIDVVALGGVTSIALPAGEHSIGLVYRARWDGHPDDVDYTNRTLWAFGLVA